MKYLIKRPETFITSINEEIHDILSKNFNTLFPEYLFQKETEAFSMPVDIKEFENEYKVKIEIPGVKKDELKIEANKKQVAAADEGLKFSLVGFDVGQNTFIDVLTSQTEKTTARQQLITSIVEYNKAQAQILFDTGLISPKTLLQNYQRCNLYQNK